MVREDTVKIPVRNLFRVSYTDMMNKLKSDVVLKMEDGVDVELHYKEVILFRYLMDVYLVTPNVKIVSKHLFTNYYTNGILTSKTINRSFEAILEDIVEEYVKKIGDRSILADVFKSMLSIINNIYNDLVYQKLEYSNSINIMDLLSIQLEPGLISAMRKVAEENSVNAVNNTYDVLDHILRYDTKFRNNVVAKGYISGTMNPNQIKQLLASRGYVTEIDSKIYHTPIASSFTLGMSNLYDLAAESRSGAKALYISTNAVQTSEYLARELQLVNMIVERLVDGDCGSTDYLEWKVRPAEVDADGKTIKSKSDIDNLIGKYYLNEETGKEEVITKHHTHLHNKTIKIRTAINCKLKDPRCICVKCFGDLAYTIPLHANIGHYATVQITELLTQSILSTKHLTSSATTKTSKIDPCAAKYFKMTDNNYYFKSNILNSKAKISLICDQSSASGLVDVINCSDINKLNIQRMSALDVIRLQIDDTKGKDQHVIIINTDNKRGYFTPDFLEHVKNHGYQIDAYDRYVVDLTGFNESRPIITLPNIEYTYDGLVSVLKSEFKKKTIEYLTPEGLLGELFDILNEKLNVNLAILEVLVYGVSVANVAKNDYGLGRNSPHREVISNNEVLTRRSLGAGYGWESLIRLILSPYSYSNNTRVDHPMDVMIRPHDVIKRYHQDKLVSA